MHDSLPHTCAWSCHTSTGGDKTSHFPNPSPWLPPRSLQATRGSPRLEGHWLFFKYRQATLWSVAMDPQRERPTRARRRHWQEKRQTFALEASTNSSQDQMCVAAVREEEAVRQRGGQKILRLPARQRQPAIGAVEASEVKAVYWKPRQHIQPPEARRPLSHV